MQVSSLFLGGACLLNFLLIQDHNQNQSFISNFWAFPTKFWNIILFFLLSQNTVLIGIQLKS